MEMYACFGLAFITLFVVEVAHANERTLYNDLFLNYNKYVRPKNDSTDTVDVTVDIELSNIKDLDETNEILHLLAFISLEWEDDFLSWNPSDYSGLESLVVAPTKVWLPDLGILNSADSFYHDTFDTKFRVYINYTGKVTWSFGGNLLTTCGLDMTLFPLDTQTCYLRVENWAYNSDQVSLNNSRDDIALVNFEDNGIWHLDHTDVTKSQVFYDHAPGVPHDILNYSMRLVRKQSFYIMTLLVPVILLMLVAQGVFWLPAESGEKVSLGVTVLLAFSVMALVIADTTPKTSDYYPVLSLYVTVIMSMTTVSTLTAILVLYMHHHDTKTRPPAIVRKIVFGCMARVFCLGKKIPQNDSRVTGGDDELIDETPSEDDVNVESVETKSQVRRNSNPDIQGILKGVRTITTSVKAQEKDAAVLEEWRVLAIVIDRSLFYMTTAVIFIASLICFT